jgi:regulator of nucleoside diphosphate kinase
LLSKREQLLHVSSPTIIMYDSSRAELHRGPVMSAQPAITLSSRDLDRIDQLLASMKGPQNPNIVALRGELMRARVVEPEAVPAGVITMNSRSRLIDESSGKTHELTLVYPKDADAATGKVSILAPVGSALLGLSTGQSIDWEMPGGKVARLKVLEVTYQPEAVGDYYR